MKCMEMADSDGGFQVLLNATPAIGGSLDIWNPSRHPQLIFFFLSFCSKLLKRPAADWL